MTERPAGRDLSAPLANVRADRVRKVAALAGRSARQRAGLLLVEGPQAVREAIRHRTEAVRDVYVREDLVGTAGPVADIAHDALARGLYVHPVTADVAAALSPDAQGLCAVASAAAITGEAVGAAPALVAILSNVRDPGNAGTAIRVADAAGADAVILAGDSVDPGNPKVIRASVGSVFHVPVLRDMDLERAVAWARERALSVVAADVAGDVEIGSAAAPHLGAPTAWLFGNEAWGLTSAELALADTVVRIPIFGEAESLNLGTAVAVCLYQSALERRR